ncbi:synaptojanin-2-binding protein-like [Sycon ciliatum]|uniref:synaptojanin-2-binding protein-like n=1 Tax=Sycon ciliatum TaxID=27933 RepID=UPI0020A911E7|eukprot:scpid89653/ scgid18482/ Disks large homolog 2; Channel-associated protein of synapse-110; Postsynaptic density protein PSD-93
MEIQPEIMEIKLNKGPNGLGFNIRGGTDNEHRTDDPGIFVTTVREKGAAAEDGRLRPGDKIVEVNDIDVSGVKHYEAVQAFHQAKDTVKLKVIRNPHPEETSESENPPAEGGSYLPYIVVFGLVGVGAYFAWKKYSS